MMCPNCEDHSIEMQIVDTKSTPTEDYWECPYCGWGEERPPTIS